MVGMWPPAWLPFLFVLASCGPTSSGGPIAAKAVKPNATSAERVYFSEAQPGSLDLGRIRPIRVRSLLNIRAPMHYGDYVWNEAGIAQGKTIVIIDLGKQLISVFRDGHEVGTAVILYGADEKPTPTGSFSILAKFRNHRSSLYQAEMPYTLRITEDGVAIHGSNVRERSATHGCIGIPLDFAERLFPEVAVGQQVNII